jgi:hypothetical protein
MYFVELPEKLREVWSPCPKNTPCDLPGAYGELMVGSQRTTLTKSTGCAPREGAARH